VIRNISNYQFVESLDEPIGFYEKI